jgi:hypothetical protein
VIDNSNQASGMATAGSASSSAATALPPSNDQPLIISNDWFAPYAATFEASRSRSYAKELVSGCYRGLAYVTATRHHLWPSLKPPLAIKEKDATTKFTAAVPATIPTGLVHDNSDEMKSSPSESTTIHDMSSMIIMAESERDHKMISCIHGCGVQVLSSYQDDHSTLCSHAPVTCQWDGCNQIMTRHQYRYHIAWCDYAFLDCPSCTPLMPHWPLQVSRHKPYGSHATARLYTRTQLQVHLRYYHSAANDSIPMILDHSGVKAEIWYPDINGKFPTDIMDTDDPQLLADLPNLSNMRPNVSLPMVVKQCQYCNRVVICNWYRLKSTSTIGGGVIENSSMGSSDESKRLSSTTTPSETKEMITSTTARSLVVEPPLSSSSSSHATTSVASSRHVQLSSPYIAPWSPSYLRTICSTPTSSSSSPASCAIMSGGLPCTTRNAIGLHVCEVKWYHEIAKFHAADKHQLGNRPGAWDDLPAPSPMDASSPPSYNGGVISLAAIVTPVSWGNWVTMLAAEWLDSESKGTNKPTRYRLTPFTITEKEATIAIQSRHITLFHSMMSEGHVLPMHPPSWASSRWTRSYIIQHEYDTTWSKQLESHLLSDLSFIVLSYLGRSNLVNRYRST